MSVEVSIDLARVRANAQEILDSTGVPLIAVVKADAYGLGAGKVAGVIGDLVEAFYVFDAMEAVAARLWDIAGKRSIALNSSWTDAKDFLSQHISPVVWSLDSAAAFCAAAPVLSVDTGQQRFSCPTDTADAVRRAGDCREVMTHAVTVQQIERFTTITQQWSADNLFLHAAGSALLGHPAARFNAVRPGLALYRGAVRATARIIEARDSIGPAGYTRFESERFGIILAGYSQGLQNGPCLVNGQLRRVLEVGMQSSFVELGARDHVGDEIVLLGDEPGVDLSAIASAWNASEQAVLVRMTKLAPRNYYHG